MGLRPVWTVSENPAPTGIRPPARSPRSESLYRLRLTICSLVNVSFSHRRLYGIIFPTASVLIYVSPNAEVKNLIVAVISFSCQFLERNK